MKKILILILIAAFAATAFKIVSDKSAAKVDMEQGVFIFMYSKPAGDFEYLGSVKKTGLVWSGKPKEMFNILLKRCKADYPQANGLVFTTIDMDKADAIKIKD